MRVLLTVPSLDRSFGGPRAKVFGLANALRQLSNDVIIVGCGEPHADAVALPALTRFHGTPIPRTVRLLGRLVGGADVVHVVGYRDPVGLSATIYARASETPFVVEPAGMFEPRSRSLWLKRLYDTSFGKRSVGSAVAFIATSHQEELQLLQGGAHANRIWVRPNGVDVDELLPLPGKERSRAALSLPEADPIVLWIGRFARTKNLPTLLRAIAVLPAVHALLVGPDSGDGTLEEICSLRKELGLGPRVRIVPEGVWGKARGVLFAAADAFCLPSVAENFGTAAVEAAALGLPTVVSATVGAGEWLPQGGAFSVRWNDVDGLSQRLAASLELPTRESARRAAPELRGMLAWPSLAEVQLRIYAEAMAS